MEYFKWHVKTFYVALSYRRVCCLQYFSENCEGKTSFLIVNTLLANFVIKK